MTPRRRSHSQGATEAHLAALETRLESQGDDLHRLSKAVEQLAAKGHPWSVIWSAIGVGVSVMLGVVALMLQGYRSDIDRLDQNQKEQTSIQQSNRHTEVQELTERARWMGATDTHIAALDKRLLALDETLQREMRLLDATGDAKLASLDKRLQQEMRLLVEPMKLQISDTRELVRRNAGDLDQMRRTRFTEADGYRIDERLREVEKATEAAK